MARSGSAGRASGEGGVITREAASPSGGEVISGDRPTGLGKGGLDGLT